MLPGLGLSVLGAGPPSAPAGVMPQPRHYWEEPGPYPPPTPPRPTRQGLVRERK